MVESGRSRGFRSLPVPSRSTLPTHSDEEASEDARRTRRRDPAGDGSLASFEGPRHLGRAPRGHLEGCDHGGRTARYGATR